MNSSHSPPDHFATATGNKAAAMDFAAVVRDAGVAIVTLDAAGRVSSWNAAAEALLGYRAGQVCGHPAPHILPAGRLPAPGRYVATRHHSDGSTLQLPVAVATVRDAGGSIVGWSEVFGPMADADGPLTVDDVTMTQRLAGAVERGEMHLLYQPIFRLADRRTVGAEALLRWRPADRIEMLPDRFIKFAERGDLIGAVGLFALRSACGQIATWKREGLRILPVSVNVSAHQFRQRDFATSFARVIGESGIDPRWLKLEITESAIVDDPATASARLDDLRALGVGIAIDDFGVGYSSLSRLRQYRIDTLKLDHSFVRDIADDAIAREVAATVIRLAHRLGMTVVAEGIETEAQYATLVELGCDCGQGFLLSRPLPGNELPELD